MWLFCLPHHTFYANYTFSPKSQTIRLSTFHSPSKTLQIAEQTGEPRRPVCAATLNRGRRTGNGNDLIAALKDGAWLSLNTPLSPPPSPSELRLRSELKAKERSRQKAAAAPLYSRGRRHPRVAAHPNLRNQPQAPQRVTGNTANITGRILTIQCTELEPQQQFDTSNKLIKSLKHNFTPDLVNSGKALPDEETLLLASCNYETNTKWGQEIGFLYGTVCEDVHTEFMLNCNGRNSVFCDPAKPQFLRNSTTNLNELLIQGTRWGSGLLDIG
ncbi:hypothetical protein HN51_039284 [Arachis hypogaea]|uniref:Cellulose synthase-like protein n=1 Tax=Arachis hypogaea TaxID=3818 RepID=A0A444YIF9_ARAHY|nr:cellulose synthase A catalytic subunit 8 [UDP-forming]-like isoform X2 [Arachis ipaensis]XP_025663055.1 cellulose synthase A catalytic subunit 8 [UDP-forming] isoform X2 [Arachis hypogaea]RYR01726.1 hypothetical protein Ahy_B06g080588 [Arachis hypogaea]